MLFGWNRVGPGLHFFSHLHGRTGDPHVYVLDPRVKQLDADTARV